MPVAELTYNGNKYSDELVANTGGLILQHSMVGETLAIDSLITSIQIIDKLLLFLGADQGNNDTFETADGYTFYATVESVRPEFIMNAPGDFKYDDNLIGRYYMSGLKRKSVKDYELTLFSAISILGQSNHVGGMYSGSTVKDILPDIMGAVEYTVDDDIGDIAVYGWLPYATRRLNLQKLLMAVGGAVKNAADGKLNITTLDNAEAGVFGADRVFFGGAVDESVPATAIQVTEYNYLAVDDIVTLYDGASLSVETITFAEPYHSYQITNGTIISSGANYITFLGLGNVLITGKRYTVITRIITEGDGSVIYSVTDNTLINPYNAADIAFNLYNYVSVKETITAEVVLGTERAGDVVRILHPLTNKLVSACIKSMAIDFGLTELRAVTKFLVDYLPPSAISGFEHYAVLTDSGNWTVPAGVTKIRIILVGGGQGGSGGNRGIDGSTSSGGAGGAGGSGGKGGLILEVNINVSPASVFAFSCGAGGAGGISDTLGQEGGQTTFGTHTSFSGRRYADGYTERKTGLRVSENGVSGIDGMAGVSSPAGGDSITHGGITYVPGSRGATVIKHDITAHGGFGGGAAAGGNGKNGQSGDVIWDMTEEKYMPVDGKGGIGGQGGIGLSADDYGMGGGGGHGGGGGGRGMNYWFGGGGIGGAGGQGGSGGKGIIIVYY